MTTIYHYYRVNLTAGQAESVAKAMKHKTPITARLTYNNLMRGNETVNLTQSQINKLEKAKNKGVGADIKISKAQLRKFATSGGSIMNIFRIVTGVAKRIFPKFLAPLATGAVSGLGETAIKKAVGGSYQLSPENVKIVVNTPEIREQIKRLLPVSQQKKLVESYECGSGLVLKTGRGQKGSFLRSLLAGIGIPLIAKLFGGCHGENVREHEDEDDRLRMFKLLFPLIDQGEIDVSQSGNGLVIRSRSTKSGGTVIPTLRYLLSSNKKRIRSSFRAKQPIQSNTFVGGSVVSKPEFINHPMSNFEIMNWVKNVKIKNFKGIISKVKNISGQCFIINLDDTEGPGTHWVAVKISKDYINVFDSFGLQPPQELVNLCYTFNKLYKYESNQFQDLSSILCGYYCLYFLKEFNGNNYFNVVKKFDYNKYKKNERYIMNYFS